MKLVQKVSSYPLGEFGLALRLEDFQKAKTGDYPVPQCKRICSTTSTNRGAKDQYSHLEFIAYS